MKISVFVLALIFFYCSAYGNECSSVQRAFQNLDTQKQKVIAQELKTLCGASVNTCTDESLQELILKYKDVKLYSLVQPRHEFENSRSIQGDINSPGVYWYKGAEREPFKAVHLIQNGKLKPEFENKSGIFVLDYKGDLYFHFQPTAGKIHHSSIAEGLPVRSAGELIVKNGKVVEIINRSGHYRPREESLLPVFAKLKELGLTDETETFKRTTMMGLESIWSLEKK
jgi:hypothetical protein